jgi:protein-disulfide isomerase
MASGTASKRKRAAQRARAQEVETKQTKRRVNGAAPWVVVGAAVVVAVAVAIGIGLTRTDETTAIPTGGSTLPNATEAAAAVAGIPQRGVALGPKTAPVTLVEFLDMQCPFCREFTVEVMPTVIEKYVRTGKVRVEVRGLAFLGPDSERGMRAALAAASQNRMFELMELLYYNQGPENSGWLTEDLVYAAARSVPGIDVARLSDDMTSGGVSGLLKDHAAEAERREVSATPTILVGKTGGELRKVTLASATDVAALEQAIAAAR